MTNQPAMTAVTPDPSNGRVSVIDTPTNGVGGTNDGVVDVNPTPSSSAESLLREVAWQIGFGTDKENISSKDGLAFDSEAASATQATKSNKHNNNGNNNNVAEDGENDRSSQQYRLDQICQRFKEEFLLEDWQLSALEASQWKELGVPMGLMASIRIVLASDTHPELAHTNNNHHHLNVYGHQQNEPPIPFFRRFSRAQSSSTTTTVGSRRFSSIGQGELLPSMLVTSAPVTHQESSHGRTGKAEVAGAASIESEELELDKIIEDSGSVDGQPSPSHMVRNELPLFEEDVISTTPATLSSAVDDVNSDLAPTSSEQEQSLLPSAVLTPKPTPASSGEAEPFFTPEMLPSAGADSTSNNPSPGTTPAVASEFSTAATSASRNLHTSSNDSNMDPIAEGQATPPVDTAGTTSPPTTRHDRPTSSWMVMKANFRMDKRLRLFAFSDTFQRALLHSKSPEDLKAHSIFVMELMVVVCALLAGAAIELWGVFPLDFVDGEYLWRDRDSYEGDDEPVISASYAMFFHFLNCFSIILQLFNTLSWASFLYVGSAVSPSQFPKYFHQTMHIHGYFLSLTGLAFIMFCTSVAMLLLALIWANVTVANVHRYWLTSGLFVAFILATVQYMNSTSYLSKIAFYGMLLSSENAHSIPTGDDEPSRVPEQQQSNGGSRNVDIRNNGSNNNGGDANDARMQNPHQLNHQSSHGTLAKREEEGLIDMFHVNRVKDADQAFDMYCRIRNYKRQQQQHRRRRQQQQQQRQKYSSNNSNNNGISLSAGRGRHFRSNLVSTTTPINTRLFFSSPAINHPPSGQGRTSAAFLSPMDARQSQYDYNDQMNIGNSDGNNSSNHDSSIALPTFRTSFLGRSRRMVGGTPNANADIA